MRDNPAGAARQPNTEETANEATDELKEQLLDQQTLWNEGDTSPKKAGGAPIGSIRGEMRKHEPELSADDITGRPPTEEDSQYQGA